MKKSYKKILYLGSFSPPIGGVTVLSAQLYEYLNKKNIQIDLIDFNKRKNIKLLKSFLSSILKCDVVTFQYGNIISYYGKREIILFVIAKILRRKIIFRCFGGNASERYKKYSTLKKLLLKYTFLSSDVIFFETIENLNYFKSITKKNNIFWFPNNKYYNNDVIIEKRKAKRFCFFGQIKSSKGIYEIYKACKNIFCDIEVHLYGPIGFDIDKSIINELEKYSIARYMGNVESSMVMDVMNTYDVLLLPTYYDGEGYPGCILEAFSLGIPVISTNWKSIPEIVDESCGELIEIKNYEELRKKIISYNTNDKVYNEKRIGALKKAKQFDSVYWNEFFVEKYKNIYNKR
ncbi:glycosyltransferase family 4 protein [Clostridium sp. 19966]|uniref:glycosyltransferase family 4 protein n=1 Tax=Clostridium sp. 19966 TaxID=2768166 RepID=UPI0028DF5E1F|nr:glycosyltransferase family 4 protein [Clostridium sp. 19966]MDT8716145.1 glycosyltransferase family 4 protein [Clostridium sp. 19966]